MVRTTRKSTTSTAPFGEKAIRRSSRVLNAYLYNERGRSMAGDSRLPAHDSVLMTLSYLRTSHKAVARVTGGASVRAGLSNVLLTP